MFAYTKDQLQRDAYLWGGGRGWGKVTVDLHGEKKTTAEMLEAAGLDWTVEKHPVEAVIDFEGNAVRKGIPRHVATVRSDNLAILGVVGTDYTPLQNADAFEFADDIVASGEAHWLTAGCTRGGARVHALMELDKDIRIGGMDDERLLPLLMFRNGHDGGLSVTVSVAPFRIVCLNGMTVPVKDAMRQWKIRHTRHVEQRMLEARATLGIAFTYYAGLEALGNQLIEEKVTDAEFETFLESLVPISPKVEEDAGRALTLAQNRREGIRHVYRQSDNLANVRGTRWGVLNAVTEYEDWEVSRRSSRLMSADELRFERATATSALKDTALELLTV